MFIVTIFSWYGQSTKINYLKIFHYEINYNENFPDYSIITFCEYKQMLNKNTLGVKKYEAKQKQHCN